MIVDWLLSIGYWGLFLGSFLASTVVPFSADFLLVGMLAVGGKLWWCLALATVGNWLGGMTSYLIGWLGRWEWIERLGVSRAKLEAQKGRVERWGVALALLAWLPIVGDLFAMALGFYRVRPTLSGLYMFIGRAARFGLWAWLYYSLGFSVAM